jgi:hypothetical protein
MGCVFENRVLRRIFGTKRNEATGEWRRLHKEELYDLYSSTNIMRIINVSRTGTGDVHTEFWWRSLRKGECLEYIDRVGR